MTQTIRKRKRSSISAAKRIENVKHPIVKQKKSSRNTRLSRGVKGKEAGSRRIRKRGRKSRTSINADGYNQAFDHSYNEGYNVGFAKGFEDGHQLAYEQQV